MLDVHQMVATRVARNLPPPPERLDCARLSGRSTREERCDMTSSLPRAASAPVLPAAGVGEKLDWDAFSARYFPGRRRHDLDAVAAYGAYKQGRDWRNSSPQTTPPTL